MMQLYTEDTYEIEGETFFGYLRGGYTQQELIAMDDYAYALGIELVPCIQTLGHLGQMLQWPKYHVYRDTNEVLLANWDETYNLIEKMITTISSPLRSKRIHIGLDEAGGVGEGRYRQIFGYEDPTRVFLNHVKRVQDICKKLDLQPMIWSDTNKNNSLAGYYDGGTPQLADTLPPDIDLVYWDYYHTASQSYAAKIEQHRELGCADPWVATAAWTWNRFWCALPFTFATIQASCQAAKRRDHGVKNMMITIWGDEGHECDMFSALPAMHYFADHGYTLEDEIDLNRLKNCFEGVCGANFDDWVYASKVMDSDMPSTLKTHFAPNTSKYLLWEDPFLAHISPQYANMNLETHYTEVSQRLAKAIEFKEEYPQNARLRMAYLVATVLSLKCHLHSRMVLAYQLGRRQDLYELTEGRLVDLQVAVDQLWKYHRSLWHKTNKPFGWEVVEMRYGGLRTRLMTMRDRILEYIEASESWQQQQQQQQQAAVDPGSASVGSQNGFNGYMQRRDSIAEGDDPRPCIPEFETIREPMYEYAGCNLLMDYARVSTPTRPG
ncbi:glycoside hydrolase superfamily [Gamsiella multidivaricata]|uniref:glycoside hydrolase superfamily n=1 Tax=Gamsiella multidivaricata TaxID=101098 RepID=UPI00221ED2CF|nr:glycoside hydrolase superfamily [Gamsiella multidivaricata]KAI7816554.1 glycoside hydrolase superfamily [Gamsiella multidivaricata]